MYFDELVTSSSREQVALEHIVAQIVSRHANEGQTLLLDRQRHIAYLHKGLKSLPEGFASLESSRPWILYWITHSLALLGAKLPSDVTLQGIVTSSHCFISEVSTAYIYCQGDCMTYRYFTMFC